jgi:hypothetical protein
MAALFDLGVLGAIVVVLLGLGLGAINAGADTRDGFEQRDERFPEHHNFGGSL